MTNTPVLPKANGRFFHYECAKMFKGFTNEEKIVLYGISRGIPEYAVRVKSSLSVVQNSERFFNPSGRLFEAPANLLKKAALIYSCGGFNTPPVRAELLIHD